MRSSILVLVAACRTHSPTPPATEPPPQTTASTSTPPSQCPELADRSQVTAAFDDGVAQLEASLSGEHFIPEKFDPAIAKLREAAEGGHAGAQALLGRTLFSTMFTNDAPQPTERDAYIEAIAFLRTAAIAGDPDASAFMPGLTLANPPLSEPPLSDVPADWVTEAWRRADAWLACHGLPFR